MKTDLRTRIVPQSQRQQSARTRHRLAAAIGAGLAASAAATGAWADTGYTWAGNSGNFSDGSSWVGGVAPTGTSVNDTVIFGGASSYDATLDNNPANLPGFYFGNLTFNNAAGSLPQILQTMPGSPSLSLNLRVANPAGSVINMIGAGDANIGVPITVLSGSRLDINVAAGAGQLSIANFNGTSTLQGNVLYGEGDVHVTNNSANAVLLGDFGTLRGDLYVDKGTVIEADGNGTVYPQFGGLTATGGGDVIGNNNLLHVAAGATFDFNNNGETMSGITGDGTVRVGAAGGLTLEYHNDLNFNGVIVGPTDGTPTTAGLTKDYGSGQTVYTFTGGTSTFTGNTTVTGGTLVMGGGAIFANSKQLTINSGNTFTIDNSTQNITDRFNGTAAVAIAGTLNLLGGTQHFGTFAIGNGPSVINLANGASMISTTLTRSGRGSFVDFTGNGSFSVSGSAVTTVGGILGYATVNGSDWATVDASNKVIPLATYQNSTNSASWAATDNVQNDGTSVTLAAAKTINSLKFTGPANLAINTGVFKVTSGGVLALNGGTISGAGSIVGGQASNAEIVFDVQGATNRLTVSANITNTPGNAVLKYGPGILNLAGTASTYTGGTRIYGGTLEVSTDANLGSTTNTSNDIFITGGGALRFLGPDFNSAVHAIAINGFGNVIDTQGYNATFHDAISGTGDLTKLGTGSLILTGTNARYTAVGVLHIAQGVVQIGTADTKEDLMGGSTIVHVDKGAALDLSFDTDGESAGSVEGDGQLRVLDVASYTYGNSDRSKIVFNGTIDPYHSGVRQGFGGALNKNSEGDLELSGASTFTGPTTIDRGTITITANALNNVPGPLGNGNTQLLIGSDSVNNFDAGFYIGKAGVTMGRDIVIQGYPDGSGFGPTGVITLGASFTNGTATFAGSINANRPLEIAAPAGTLTNYTGAIKGTGTLTILGGGTVSIANNQLIPDPFSGYGGGVTVNSSTLLINASSGMGAAGVAFNLNGGTVQTSVGFSTDRPINLDSSGGGINNTDTVNPLTLTGTLNANGPLGKAGAGTVQLAQSGPLTIPGLAINAGTLGVSTGGPLTVTGAMSGAGTLNVANGVTVRMQAPTTTVHSIGTLALNTSGTIDLGNNRLLTTATPLAQVRSYLLQARNGGSWTGVGGLTSSTVKANPITFGMAYFSGANPANATLSAVPGMSNPNAVFVRPAQIGDFNGDGIVDRFDIRQFNTRGTFNDGGTNHDWADGDLNNDGVVDRFDIRAFNTAGNFNNGVTFAAQSAAQPATLTAKASSAAPAVAPINTPTTVGLTGDGKPDLVYNPDTGDVIFKYDGFVPPAASPLVEMEIDSAKGSLRPDNASPTVAGSLTTSADGKLIDFANLGPTAIADGVNLGQIFPTNSNALALTSGDISVSLFLYHDQTGSSYFADVIGGTAGVPEPTSLALLGVAAAGLLGRRRRRQK